VLLPERLNYKFLVKTQPFWNISSRMRTEKADLYRCRALWLAVIYRALCDACYQCFDQYQLNKHASLGAHFISRETSLLTRQTRQFLLANTTRSQQSVISPASTLTTSTHAAQGDERCPSETQNHLSVHPRGTHESHPKAWAERSLMALSGPRAK
jgi:hypothetical protein